MNTLNARTYSLILLKGNEKAIKRNENTTLHLMCVCVCLNSVCSVCCLYIETHKTRECERKKEENNKRSRNYSSIYDIVMCTIGRMCSANACMHRQHIYNTLTMQRYAHDISTLYVCFYTNKRQSIQTAFFVFLFFVLFSSSSSSSSRAIYIHTSMCVRASVSFPLLLSPTLFLTLFLVFFVLYSSKLFIFMDYILFFFSVCYLLQFVSSMLSINFMHFMVIIEKCVFS